MQNLLTLLKTSIKTKLLVMAIVPLLAIVIFASIYYPSKMKTQAITDAGAKVHTLSEMLAFSVGAGLSNGDFELVQTAFDWAKKDQNTYYIVIIDDSGEVLIEHNPNKLNVDHANLPKSLFDEETNLFKTSLNIVYADTEYGKIGVFYSLETVNAEINSNLIISLIILLTILAISTVVIFILSRMISNNIISLRNAAVEASSGNLDVDIDTSGEDEVGDLSKAFEKMLQEIKASSEALETEKSQVEKKVEDAVRESENTKNYLSKSIEIILAVVEKLSSGDLTVQVDINSKDEIGKLSSELNSAIDNVRNLLLEVKQAVVSTISSSNDITSATEEMAAGAAEQSAQTNDVAAAVEEMARTIIETTQNASNAAQSSQNASEQARVGYDKVEETKRGMEEIVASTQQTGKVIESLTGKTEQIGEIAQVIDDIADQTNLLALNAAIEAARAGEQGRGFAVVADEVRKLAERTTKATKEIAETIKDIQNEARQANQSMTIAEKSVINGMERTNEVSNALQEILNNSESVAAEIEQVATASEEQSSTAEEISKSIEMINNVTRETSNAIENVARSAENLHGLTQNLGDLISSFTIEKEGLVHHSSSLEQY
ncbi:MAG: HAMP domain-containing protein [Melioribacteraceae bacterium]|nr:HAMP domain-containing protein [Melioribacteraceae bacterium]